MRLWIAGTLLLVALLPPPAVAQTSFRSNATILEDGTPVLLYPDASRTPLTKLAAGTPIRAGEPDGEWLSVTFEDPRFGRRVGYVLRQHVWMDGTPRPTARQQQVAPGEQTTTKPTAIFAPSAMLAVNRARLSIADLVRARPASIPNELTSITRADTEEPRRPSTRNVARKCRPRCP